MKYNGYSRLGICIVLTVVAFATISFLFLSVSVRRKVQTPITEFPIRVGNPDPVNQVTENSDVPAKADPLTELEERIEFSKYQEISQYTDDPVTEKRVYQFLKGQELNRDTHRNYTLKYPKTWTAYVYTNEIDREDYGTNILLKKGNDYIVIKQQLYESGTCWFGNPSDAEGMSYPCNLSKTITRKDYRWKVYTRPENVDYVGQNAYPWKMYGVCDQDSYAREVDSPTARDKLLCSPWTSIGEIDYYALSGNKQNLQEFYDMLATITILD